MPNMTTEEGGYVLPIQDDFATVKQVLRRMASNAQKLSKLDRDAGKIAAGNAAMRLQGALTSALGDIIQAHADASDALAAAYDDGGVVIMGGGGGR